MNARELVKALKGHWHGNYGMCCCPAHQDRTPSLSIRDGDDGMVLVHCHAGCDQSAVIDALKARGLWENARRVAVLPQATISAPPPENPNSPRAREIWTASRPIGGTLGEVYFQRRGITTSLPGTLRFHRGLKHTPTGLDLPAIVAAVAVWPSKEVVAVHRTYLDHQGRKASVSMPKMALGPVSGGAIRLRSHADELVVAEGIETALSVCQCFSCSAWACLSSSNMPNLKIAADVREITIAADRDANGAGQKAANRLADRLRREGKTVRIMLPPKEGDWNDVLMEGVE
jgi:hypothetical protein